MEFIIGKIDKYFILQCYKEDPEHVQDVYVIDVKTPEACVKDTVEKLKETDCTGNIANFYKIFLENDIIGFFAINKGNIVDTGIVLRTFYIRKQFRREYSKEFINQLKSIYGEFSSFIYNTNYKTIGYFNRNGGLIVDSIVYNDKIVLKFKFK